MKGMASTLSVIATIASAMALIGVVVSLILQNRQLKASQIQVMREMHLELMKVGIENPVVAASMYEDISATDMPAAAVLNLTVNLWATGYSLKVTNKDIVAFHAAHLFASEFPRTWWATLGRDAFEAEAGTKLEKEFFAILDRAFQDAIQSLQSASLPGVNPSSEE